MWDWLQSLSGGAATFIGSATGSAIGLIALLLGALFNAHLNRRRDDALRKADAQATVTALRAELDSMAESLHRNAANLDNPAGNYTLPDLSHQVRVMPALISKFGLLNENAVKNIIESYVSIDQYYEQCLLLGGQAMPNLPANRRVLYMPENSAHRVSEMNRRLAVRLKSVVDSLEHAV